jgi:hypothetical protein
VFVSVAEIVIFLPALSTSILILSPGAKEISLVKLALLLFCYNVFVITAKPLLSFAAKVLKPVVNVSGFIYFHFFSEPL